MSGIGTIAQSYRDLFGGSCVAATLEGSTKNSSRIGGRQRVRLFDFSSIALSGFPRKNHFFLISHGIPVHEMGYRYAFPYVDSVN